PPVSAPRTRRTYARGGTGARRRPARARARGPRVALLPPAVRVAAGCAAVPCPGSAGLRGAADAVDRGGGLRRTRGRRCGRPARARPVAALLGPAPPLHRLLRLNLR